MTQNTTSAKWARWQWSKGLGRAHRLFIDGDLTKTACQTPRKTADHTAETARKQAEFAAYIAKATVAA